MRTRSKSSIVSSLVVGIVLAGAANNAWATCYGAECEDGNPVTLNCYRDAVILDTADITDPNALEESPVYGEVQLRYSPICNAKWVQVNYFHSLPAVNRVVTMMNVNGGPYALGINNERSMFISKMTNGVHVVRACTMISLHFYLSNDRSGCTDYR